MLKNFPHTSVLYYKRSNISRENSEYTERSKSEQEELLL